jgi:hypothetical protein
MKIIGKGLYETNENILVLYGDKIMLMLYLTIGVFAVLATILSAQYIKSVKESQVIIKAFEQEKINIFQKEYQNSTANNNL